MRVATSLLALAAFGCGAGRESLAEVAPDAARVTNPDPGTVVASWQGGQVTWGELDEAVGMRLKSMEVEYLVNRFDTQSQAMDGLVRDRILEAEAASRGITLDELFRIEVEAKAAAPSEEEIASFYEQNRARIGDATLDDVRPIIIGQLSQQKQGERFREWYTELELAKGVTRALAYPDLPRIDVPIADHDPSVGPADAPVTIVQFAEYECYYCQRALPTVDQVMAAYDGRVRLVFKDYPLGFHQRARPAAIAAHCAGDQGKYWEMNHLLLNNQQDLSDAGIRLHAEGLALDLAAFDACLTSGKFDTAIAEDMSTAEQVGVGATPTFFVNGVLVSGAQPFEKFQQLIDRELGS
jgi:protein-disulfide isomerase